jgi:hypothetical protein
MLQSNARHGAALAERRKELYPKKKGTGKEQHPVDEAARQRILEVGGELRDTSRKGERRKAQLEEVMEEAQHRSKADVVVRRKDLEGHNGSGGESDHEIATLSA